MDRNYFRFLDAATRSVIGLPSLNSNPRNMLSQAAFNQGYYQRFFKEGRRLGRGAGGSVHLCQHVLDGVPLGEYAVKKVPVGKDYGWLVRMLKEVHVLESLRHENIIEYKHTWIEILKLTPFGPPVPCLLVLMQYANGGNFEEYITSEAIDTDGVVGTKKKHESSSAISYLPEQEILRILLGVAKGVAHLHHLGILHRDLKPSNLLLHFDRGQVSRPNVLIADFGECVDAKNLTNASTRTGATGTLEFTAPELHRQDSKGEFSTDHSTASDIWSLGMVMYHAYFGGALPYGDIQNVLNLRQEILNLRGHVNVTSMHARPIDPGISRLMEQMLTVDPEKRPTAAQVVAVMEQVLGRQHSNTKAMRSKKTVKLPFSIVGPQQRWRVVFSKVIYSNFYFISLGLAVSHSI